MLIITNHIIIPTAELEYNAIRAQGPGGQNVNKVSSAIHLRFDIKSSSLPAFYQDRLLSFRDQRITKDGIIVIKAQQHRTQEKNREDALHRLRELILKATAVIPTRRATKPSRSSKRRRMDSKNQRGKTKTLRGRVVID
jgi:ribosome-associated protein